MSKEKADQQLLEDASTLLMFANAAARQRSPGVSVSSQSPPVMATNEATTVPAQGPSPHLAGRSRTSLIKSPTGIYQTASFATLPPTHRRGSGGILLPQAMAPLQRLPHMGSAAHFLPGAVPTPQQVSPRLQHQPAPPQPQPQPQQSLEAASYRQDAPVTFPSSVSPHQVPVTPYTHYDPTKPEDTRGLGHGINAAFPPKHEFPQHRNSDQGRQVPGLQQSFVLPRAQSPKSQDHAKKSQSRSLLISEKVLHHSATRELIKIASKANSPPPAPDLTKQIHANRAIPKTALRPLSPKPPADDQPAEKLILSPRIKDATARSPALQHQPSPPPGTSSARKSVTPVTPNGAYARGISVESGKRNTDNAMIAAAALAQAADIPLPLKIQENASPPTEPLVKVEHPVVKIEVAASAEQPVITETEEHHKNVEAEEKPKPLELPQIRFAEKDVVDPKPAAPPLDEYKVDPDAGTIGCICGIEEDDGFTIQCDICFRWQHCSCMGYKTSDEVPENEYKCYFCDENKWNKFDPEVCRAATIARLELESEPVEKPPKRKSLGSGHEEKKRRKSEKDVRGPQDRPVSEKRKSSNSLPIVPTVPEVAEICNKDNPLLKDGITAENYQSVYYKLQENDYKTPKVRKSLSEVSARLVTAGDLESLSLEQFKNLTCCRILTPNHEQSLRAKGQTATDDSKSRHNLKVHAYSENPKQKFVGITKLGLFISDSLVLGEGETVIPLGTNVIEYLGEIDYWSLHVNNRVNQYALWGTAKPQVVKVTLPSKNKTFESIVLDSRFVGNESRFIRKSCPSSANCTVKPIFDSTSKQLRFVVVTTKDIKFEGDIAEEELRISWDWDDAHPIRQMMRLCEDGTYEPHKKFEDFGDEEKSFLVSCVDAILSFVECGCTTSTMNQLCLIYKVKKATLYLLRLTRKAFNLGNSNLSKLKEDLIFFRKPKTFVPWQDRMMERDNMSLAKAFILGDEELDKSPSENTETKPDSKRQIDNSSLANIRKHLLMPSCPQNNFRYKVLDVDAETVDIKSIGDVSKLKFTAPLTQEIISQIKEKVNEAFKPLGQVTNHVAVVEKKIPKAVIAPAAKVDTVIKPAPVKKLLFADYKKKMK